MDAIGNFLKTFKASSMPAKAAIILAWIGAVLHIVSMKAIEHYFRAYHNLGEHYLWTAPQDVMSSEMGAARTMMFVVSIAMFISIVLAIILFMRWLYLANLRCSRLGVKLDDKPGWAVGWWFVPLLNTFMPYIVLKNMLSEIKRTIEGVSDEKESKWLLTWWICLLALVLLDASTYNSSLYPRFLSHS